MSANEIWNVVIAYIDKNKQFLSSTGTVKYNAIATFDFIEYKGGKNGSVRAMNGESISRNQFISILDKSMIWNVSILKMSSHTLIEGKAHLSAY